LANAEKEFKRETNLVRKNVVTKSKFDAARTSRDTARAQLQAAKAALQKTNLDLSYTKIRAPFDGIVTAHRVDAGSLVGRETDTALATILSADPVYIEFHLSERDLLDLRRALRTQGVGLADLSVYAIRAGISDDGGYPFVGSLDYISPEIEESTGTALVRAIFPNPQHDLIPGGFVRLQLPLDTGGVSLVIPSQAIGTNQLGRFVIVVGEGGIAERRQITLGGALSDGRQAVRLGLSSKDRVIVENLHRAVPGRAVKPVELVKSLQASDAGQK
jgi:RND family efflux transporter MFP subunit